MRIAFSGAGTSQYPLIESFLHTWDNYTTPTKSYVDIIAEKKLQHSDLATTETQAEIVNLMIDELQSADKDTKIVYDRCLLDSIAYSMWCHDKKIEGFTKNFVTEQIALMRQSMSYLDIIFLCRFDENHAIKQNDTTAPTEECAQDVLQRKEDLKFLKEMDNIFYSLYNQYVQAPEADIFFPVGDTPCILTLPIGLQQGIDLIAEYVNPAGELPDEEQSILDPANINELEALVYEQKNALAQEEKENELQQKFGLPDGGFPSITL